MASVKSPAKSAFGGVVSGKVAKSAPAKSKAKTSPAVLHAVENQQGEDPAVTLLRAFDFKSVRLAARRP